VNVRRKKRKDCRRDNAYATATTFVDGISAPKHHVSWMLVQRSVLMVA
jgi:hypothetical protein